jgi:hypothetical protein
MVSVRLIGERESGIRNQESGIRGREMGIKKVETDDSHRESEAVRLLIPDF